MKILFYVVHNTHTLNHIDNSMLSLMNQQQELKWDKLVIKNSIEGQIPNDTIQKIIDRYNLSLFFKTIEFVVAGATSTTYSDLKDAVDFAKKNDASFLMFAKAEYCYSCNFYGFLKKLFENEKKNDWVFTPPIVNVTEIGTIENVTKKLKEEKFSSTDENTGYDGDDHYRLEKKIIALYHEILFKLRFKKREFGEIQHQNLDVNKRYQFISHHVILDINVHVFDKNALKKMDFSNEELNLKWGRIRSLDRLYEKGTDFIISKECFSIHLFHEIPSARLGRNINGIRY